MRLPTLPAIVALTGLALASSSAAASAPKEQTMQAAWHGTSWSVPIDLKGRAAPRATVTASAPCAIGTCTATTTAGTKGRWAMHFDGIVKPGAARLPVKLLSGGRAVTRDFRVAAPTDAAPGIGTVMVVGDSLAVGSAGLLAGLMPERRVTTQALGGRPLLEGTDIFRATPLDDRIAVAVFSLFTNNDPRAVRSLRTEVGRASTRLGPKRCAVWFTIVRPPVDGVSFKAANKALQAMAAAPSTGGRLVIVPWAEAIAKDPKILGKDRVHPTPAGYRLRAQMTADAIRRCPGLPTP